MPISQRTVELDLDIATGHIILGDGHARHDIGRFVSGISLAKTAVGDIPVLTLTLPVPKLAAKFRGQVEVDAETAAALVELGWTPPESTSERIRRDYADAHRDDIVPGSGVAIEPKDFRA